MDSFRTAVSATPWVRRQAGLQQRPESDAARSTLGSGRTGALVATGTLGTPGKSASAGSVTPNRSLLCLARYSAMRLDPYRSRLGERQGQGRVDCRSATLRRTLARLYPGRPVFLRVHQSSRSISEYAPARSSHPLIHNSTEPTTSPPHHDRRCTGRPVKENFTLTWSPGVPLALAYRS